jgi:hypothetical protein
MIVDTINLNFQILEPVIEIDNFITDFEEYDFMPNEMFKKTGNLYDNERELYSILQMESFNIKGTPVEYLAISYDVEYNKIWGEDNDRNYLSAFDVMAYYELPQETEMWTKYSIEGIDVFHMFINKLHFNKISGGSGIFPLDGGYSPKIGDLIRSVYNNFYYEIVNVNHTEEMFLQFKHSWDLIVKPFKNERNIK